MSGQELHAVRYKRSCQSLRTMIEERMPEVMVQNEARLLLEATYHGPCRMICGLIFCYLKAACQRFAFSRFEWARRRVFKRIPCSVLTIRQWKNSRRCGEWPMNSELEIGIK